MTASSLVLCLSFLLAAETDKRPCVIVVVGAQGTEEYGEHFETWTNRWEEAAVKAHAKFIRVGPSSRGGVSDKELLQEHLAAEQEVPGRPTWIVLIGHGTFDGRSAKFNLVGPDLSATELAKWLDSWKGPLAIINCASSSGPFINRLSAPNRVIVTATKSGYEHNYCRFGDYVSRAIADETIDLDKDEQTSLLEAFLAASAGVAEFYDQEARLATEHALLDDNGDGLGTPASWFRGVRATRRAKADAAPDGLRANQFHFIRSDRERAMSPEARVTRDRLEADITRLRESKVHLPVDDYYARLEELLLALAQLYEEAEGAEEAAVRDSPDAAASSEPHA